MPAKPAAWVVAMGGLAGLAGAMLQHRLAERPKEREPLNPLPADPGVPWQVNRLFLYNTLQNAAALTVADSDRARMVIEKLAEYIRVVHELALRPTTLLNLELRCAEMFLSIERSRFQDRLEVLVEAERDCLEAVLPALLLQPLVAFAIRDGVERTDARVSVRLKAWCDKSSLILEVEHNGPGETDPARQQQVLVDLGFPQLEQLLDDRYKRMAGVEIESIEPEGNCVRIRLPYEERSTSDDDLGN